MKQKEKNYFWLLESTEAVKTFLEKGEFIMKSDSPIRDGDRFKILILPDYLKALYMLIEGYDQKLLSLRRAIAQILPQKKGIFFFNLGNPMKKLNQLDGKQQEKYTLLSKKIKKLEKRREVLYTILVDEVLLISGGDFSSSYVKIRNGFQAVLSIYSRYEEEEL